MNLQTLAKEVLEGKKITREEAFFLYDAPLQELCDSADKIREHFCGDQFDICTIINAKSGKCSENCKFCAQSAHYDTNVTVYSMRDKEAIVAEAQKNYKQGVLRYAMVTSGKRLSEEDIDTACEATKEIKEKVGISVCASFGLLNEAQYRKLKAAGVVRVHNNLETSRSFFPKVCTTHTFDEKVSAIKAAKAAGLSVCSGGIVGLGESAEDRIDLALSLRELGIKNVPINVLNPIPGTPFENNERLSMEEIRRIIAVFRFILPDASIRLAGGRGLMPDKGKSCFEGGANAAISGDMLTTSGITTETDMKLLAELGYEVKLYNE